MALDTQHPASARHCLLGQVPKIHRTAFRAWWRVEVEKQPEAEAAAVASRFAGSHSATHRRDGKSQPNLGRATDCQRTEAQTRNSSLTAHRSKVPQRAPVPPRLWSTTLEFLHTQPRQSHRGVSCDFFVSVTATSDILRLRSHGDPLTPHSAPQRYRTSNRRVDHSAVL